MNKIYKFLLFIGLSLCLFLGLAGIKAKAYSYLDLDYIQKYEIWVNPVKEDGSLNIEFHIVWEVLDSSSDGPLEWIKIGIPNYHAKDIVALSNGIKKIKYYSDGGSYIRIDFSDRYYRGDVVDIRFKYNQSYMYHLDGDNVVYDYHPGWFDEIIVNECNLYWAKDGVEEIAEGITSGVDFSEDGNYYQLSKQLNYGQTIKMRLRYQSSFFDSLDPEKQYTDRYVKPVKIIIGIGIACLVIAFIIGMYIYYKNQQDPYMNERGFCTGYYRWYLFNRPHYYYGKNVDSKGARIINPSSGGSHGGFSGGGGCACACACACAGGGRAGCSKKDFYHTNLQSDKVIDALKEE